MKPRELRRSFLRSLRRATLQATIPLLGFSLLFYSLQFSTPFIPRPPSQNYDVPSIVSDDSIISMQVPTNVSGDTVISNVIELSLLHVEPPHSISAAVCYKALFGTIDFGIILQWVGTCLVLIVPMEIPPVYGVNFPHFRNPFLSTRICSLPSVARF